MENKMEVSIASTCSDVEMEAMNSNELSEMESCDHNLAGAIAGQNKRITDLEQEIADLKSQLQNAQRQITNLMEKQFTLENLKSKNNTAPFYTGFNSWDAFDAVYNYLHPGGRGENIVYWRSVNAEVSVDYDQDQSEESFTKKGRARSLRPVDEFFIVMCRLRQGLHEDHLARLFNV
jgi:TolA-binding protein